MADQDSHSKMVRNITICIVVAASAGVVMTIYQCLKIRYMLNLGRTGNTNNHLHHQQRQTVSMRGHQATPSCIEASTAQVIPSYKYQKGGDHSNDSKGVAEKDDGMCPVCLSDFENGEEVRSLPGCLHSFHAPCIDMWLFSHQNCPVCRTIATPSPRMLLRFINSNLESPVAANMQMHYTSLTDRLV